MNDAKLRTDGVALHFPVISLCSGSVSMFSSVTPKYRPRLLMKSLLCWKNCGVKNVSTSSMSWSTLSRAGPEISRKKHRLPAAARPVTTAMVGKRSTVKNNFARSVMMPSGIVSSELPRQ
ncbi:hypothetical protein D9M68_557520 [compost metagenome]